MKKKIALLQGGFNVEIMKEVMHGVLERTKEEGADLYIFNCYGGDSEDLLYNKGEYGVFSLIQCEDYDGLILAANNITSHQERKRLAEMLAKSGKPVVSMEFVMEGLHRVGCDNYRSMKEVTRHMIEVHGCRKIFFLAGPEKDNYESDQRLLGVQDGMKEAGIELKKEWIRYSNYTYVGGKRAFEDFWEAEGELPDCLIAANDEMAIGYCAAAREHGFYAPEDFLVAGFDNSRFSESYKPRLTTVDRETFGAGYQGCDVLFRLISGEEVPQITNLETKVAYRSSCGCKESRNRRKMGRRLFVESSLMLKHMNMNVQVMYKKLVQCENWKEYCSVLEENVREIGCQAMYLMVNRGEKLHPYSNKSVLENGFDEKMSVMFAWEQGNLLSYEEPIDVRTLFPQDQQDEESHSYLICPVHFQEREIGYCVIKDSATLIDNESVYTWAHSINMSMEILLERLALKKANEMLDALSSIDALTGVYNRIGLTRYAEKLLCRDRRKNRETLILFADINKLKFINDTYGHESGDLAIRTVADVLKQACPKNSLVVRYGGDEFVMIISDCNEEMGEKLKKEMNAALKLANEKNDFPYELSSSIGYICANPEEENPLEYYVKKADDIMYKEKKKRKENNSRNC